MAQSPVPLIGPGRLVLVVGPSGAGKDTLIDLVRRACVDDEQVVFPRRLVTRPASGHEDHDSISEQAFTQAVAGGALAFWWTAHGLHYGLPSSLDEDIRRERTVVCNVSRTVIAPLRKRYAHVIAVLVTAPPEVLALRLQSRARASDGSLDDRLRRSQLIDKDFDADFVIHNTSDPAIGADQLMAAIRTPAATPAR